MFQKARIKLTFWYLVIIMFVSISFSGLVYNVLVREVVHFEQMQRLRIERRLEQGGFGPGGRVRILLTPLTADPELIEEAKRRVLHNLVLLNATVLVASAGLGYILAGRTLLPISAMIEEQNRFISDASHELKTPLTSLKTSFEVFLRNKKVSTTEAKILVGESLEDVERLQTLSESMISLTGYQKPNDNFRFEKISLKQTIDKAIKRTAVLANARSITIDSYIPSITIKADKYSLTDLFVILLDNAVKYSPAKSKIVISATKEKRGVRVEVKDEGMGISQKDLPHIFKRFYRADKARQKVKRGGYGLGLSIAKRIADINKANITVKSKVEKGSVFILRLPSD